MNNLIILKKNDVKNKKENKKEKLFDQFQASSNKNRNIFFVFITFIAFIFTAILGTKDVDLLFEYSVIYLPIINTQIALKEFYIFSPVFVLMFYFVLMFNAYKHLDKTIEYDREHKKHKKHNEQYDKEYRLQPFLLDFVYVSKRHPFIRLLTNIMYIWITPALLTFFLARFSDYQSLYITGLHFIFVLVSFLIVLHYFFPNKFKEENNTGLIKLFQCIIILIFCVLYLYFVYKTIGIEWKAVLVVALSISSFLAIIFFFFKEFYSKVHLWHFAILIIIFNIALWYLLISTVVYLDSHSKLIYDNICSKTNSRSYVEKVKCNILFPRILIEPNVNLLQTINRNHKTRHDTKFISLRNRSLKFVHMENVNLDGADLSNSNFLNGNFKQASIRFANLTYSNFDNVDLNSSNLTCSNLIQSDFNKSNLYESRMWGVALSGNNFSSTNLEDAELRYIHFEKPEEKNICNLKSIKDFNSVNVTDYGKCVLLLAEADKKTIVTNIEKIRENGKKCSHLEDNFYM